MMASHVTSPPAAPGTDPNEEALVRGLMGREHDAVSTFVDRTHRVVYAKACRLTSDPELRQDWTHNTLLAVLDELARGHFVYRWPGCFWSWFGKRSHFLLLNQYNRQKRRSSRYVGGEPGEDALTAAPVPPELTPDRLLENVEIRATLEHCLEALPSADHRRALTLLLFEEMTYEEIAAALSSPLNTVRSWIRRGRISVRKCVSRAFALPAAAEEFER